MSCWKPGAYRLQSGKVRGWYGAVRINIRNWQNLNLLTTCKSSGFVCWQCSSVSLSVHLSVYLSGTGLPGPAELSAAALFGHTDPRVSQMFPPHKKLHLPNEINASGGGLLVAPINVPHLCYNGCRLVRCIQLQCDHTRLIFVYYCLCLRVDCCAFTHIWFLHTYHCCWYNTKLCLYAPSHFLYTMSTKN